MLITSDSQLNDYYAKNRLWQGIPSIERTAGGRLFASFYSGGPSEGQGNWCVLTVSDDDGLTWSEPVAAAISGKAPSKLDGTLPRCYDPCLWADPEGRLWFLWSVSPDEPGVWCAVCENPDAQRLIWAEPRRIADGIMLNKPTVTSDGVWLFPIAVWRRGLANWFDTFGENESGAFVYASSDSGRSFECIGGADISGRWYDEHMFLELRDRSLMMLVRTSYGIGSSFSYDGGVTWTPGGDSGLGGPNSRFHIRRLASGNVLLINHYKYSGRNNLTTMVSRDDCKTWEGYLPLDERKDVSYPDALQSPDGFIYIIYDRERGNVINGNPIDGGAREILMAKITEADILSGNLLNPHSKLKSIVSKL